MARNTNRDRLIQTFLSRNRRADTNPVKSTAPGAPGSALPGRKPTVSFRPAKRTTKPSRY
jgi:hypothetical protein